MATINFDFITYMENVAVKLKELRHSETSNRKFHQASGIAELEGLLNSGNLTRGLQMVAVNNHEGSISDNGAEGLLDQRYLSFYILKNVKNLDDMDERLTTLNEVKLVVKKILSKFFKDWKDDNNDPDTRQGLLLFDRNTIKYFNVGPLGDQYIGIQVTFTNPDTFSYAYKASDWDE